ncbi:unnamed protein product, partial [Choristocarpus tenellus]
MVGTTRIIVKNIPKHVDERRIREHFGEKGQVTDAKIVRTKDGRSRQFAFVGFATEEDSKHALQYYNRTFLDTSRIEVEPAHKKGNSEIARPWSKYSSGSSRMKHRRDQAESVGEGKVTGKGDTIALNPQSKGRDGRMAEAKAGVLSRDKAGESGSKTMEGEDDVEKEEFMAVMKKRSEARFWDNDDVVENKKGGEDLMGDEEEVTESEQSVEEDDEGDESGGTKGTAVEGEVPGRTAESGLSDMDWLRSRTTGRMSDSEESSEEGEGDSEGEKEGNGGEEGEEEFAENRTEVERSLNKEKGKKDDDVEEDFIEEGGLSVGRLFVRNLPFTCTEDDLKEVF